jgi:hypothetical protein
VAIFNVVDKLSEESSRGKYVGHFPGLIRPRLLWETKLQNGNNGKLLL